MVENNCSREKTRNKIGAETEPYASRTQTQCPHEHRNSTSNYNATFQTTNACIKGIVPPKMKIVIIYSPSCRSKPVRVSFLC